MMYSRDHQRSIGTMNQTELFHNALMASRHATPAKSTASKRITSLPEVEDGFSEIKLNGAPKQCLQWLAPVLRDLSQAEAPRWLTLLDPPATVSHKWLRSAGLDPERILIVRGKPGMDSLELCCDLLRLGCSHTVVSWLATDGNDGRSSHLLRKAAGEGHCQSLNVYLETCLAA
tara:strand:+ start:2423 stop:2944 length:522 start_codon:yes stop_codon:yes gene_type:complete